MSRRRLLRQKKHISFERQIRITKNTNNIELRGGASELVQSLRSFQSGDAEFNGIHLLTQVFND